MNSKDMTRRTLGRIEAEVKSQGVTQEQLSAACGIHQTAISRRLSGEARLTVDELIRMASALHVKPGDLFDDEFVVSSWGPPRTITITVPAGAEVRMTS